MQCWALGVSHSFPALGHLTCTSGADTCPRPYHRHNPSHLLMAALKGWGQHCFLFLFFVMFLFIYFLLCWVFVAAHGLSLVVAHRGYSLLRCAGFSLRCFSCCGARALGAPTSVVVARGLRSCGSRALQRRLSSCGARA